MVPIDWYRQLLLDGKKLWASLMEADHQILVQLDSASISTLTDNPACSRKDFQGQGIRWLHDGCRKVAFHELDRDTSTVTTAMDYTSLVSLTIQMPQILILLMTCVRPMDILWIRFMPMPPPGVPKPIRRSISIGSPQKDVLSLHVTAAA